MLDPRWLGLTELSILAGRDHARRTPPRHPVVSQRRAVREARPGPRADRKGPVR